MRSTQLWFWPHPRPLVERLGAEFFRQLPECPGVYLMCGSAEGVLYVGKAKNLRRRLSSYRVANPGHFPRRIIRLLCRVTRIEWDECVSETMAGFREEMLIAVLQPRFNSAGNVWPVGDDVRSRVNLQRCDEGGQIRPSEPVNNFPHIPFALTKPGTRL
jgi:hypothetical protein